MFDFLRRRFDKWIEPFVLTPITSTSETRRSDELDRKEMFEIAAARQARRIATNPAWPLPTRREFLHPLPPCCAPRLVVDDEAEQWTDSRLLAALNSGPVVRRGDLCLRGSRIRRLPERLAVEGTLDLRRCARLASLGDELRVGRDLWIGEGVRPPLVQLPRVLRVGRDFILHKCDYLQTLGEGVSVGRNIHIQSCANLKQIGEGVAVQGNLTLIGCRSLRELPSHLHVEGDLRLIGLPIERLPDGLSIGRSLILQDCLSLKSLPDGLQIPGGLTIRASAVEQLPKSLVVGEHVKLIRCPNLAELGSAFSFGADLVIQQCPELQRLPEALKVPGRLALRKLTRLQKLPSCCRIGFSSSGNAWQPKLSIQGCPGIVGLPNDLEVRGPLDLIHSHLQTLPEHLRTNGIRYLNAIVPPELIFAPEKLTADDVLNEPNAEVRRRMIDRIGCDWFLQRANLELVDRDQDAGGIRSLYAHRRLTRWLHCRCPSTSRQYLLAVPRQCETCHQAAAWIAGFDDPDDYQPLLET